MKKITYRLSSFLIFAALFASEGNGDVFFGGFTSASEENKLYFTNPGYEMIESNVDGVNYIKPEMNGAGSEVNPGEPHLPTISTYYAIAPGKNYSIEFSVQDFEIIENVDVLPFDTWNPVKEKNSSKANIYNMNTSFPEEIASVSSPIVFRDITMVQVSITPFQYNPGTKPLTVIQDIEIDLIEGENIDMPFIPSQPSREFEKLYKS